MRTIKPIPLGEFRQLTGDIYRAAGKARKTAQQIDHVLRLAEASGATTTTDLTTATAARFVLDRGDGANPNTTRGLLGRLRAATNLAVRLGHLDREDAPDWRSLWPRAGAARRGKAHTAAEVAALLDHLLTLRSDWTGRRLCALGWLVAYTGLRRNEALLARVEDLDLARGFVFVSARSRLKTRASAAPVPLPAELVAVLEAWVPECGGTWLFPGARREGPWVGGSPGYRPLDRLRAAGVAAGVRGVGFHSLRHSLATHLLLTGVPVWAIQRVLRHTSEITTEHYLHPSDLEVAALVRGIAYRRPASGIAS